MKLSKRLDKFSEYIFASLAKRVEEIETITGKKVLNLGPGTPDVVPSKKYISKLQELITDSKAHYYPGYSAILELKNALQRWYRKRFNVGLDDNEILPLLGAKDGISHLPLTLANEHDQVLVPDPGYPGFTGPLLMFGIKPIYYDLTEHNHFKININELESKITNKTKFIWVNFPSNPTGQVTNHNELKTVVNFAKKHQIWLIYDNAYSEITFDNYIAPSVLEINGAKDIAVEIGSFSKTFSFAGYRMGWAVGNLRIIQALSKIKSQLDSGLSLPLQKLGAYALEYFDNNWHKYMIKSYEQRRDTIANYLRKIGLRFNMPKAGLYLWAKIPDDYKNSEEFSIKLLENKQILVTPGTAFGKNGARYVRVSICANIDNIRNYF